MRLTIFRSFSLILCSLIASCGASETSVIRDRQGIYSMKIPSLEAKILQKKLKNTDHFSERCEILMNHIKTASTLFNLDEALIAGVIKVESNFRADAVSRQGAVGLMQILPSSGKYNECGDLYDPIENILCGTKILKRFIEYYDGNLLLGLSGYNGGHYYANKSRDSSHLPENFDYVERVLIMRAKYLDHKCRF
jgi:soluble lytic murein transglycosylase-like protein